MLFNINVNIQRNKYSSLHFSQALSTGSSRLMNTLHKSALCKNLYGRRAGFPETECYSQNGIRNKQQISLEHLVWWNLKHCINNERIMARGFKIVQYVLAGLLLCIHPLLKHHWLFCNCDYKCLLTLQDDFKHFYFSRRIAGYPCH